MDNRIISLVFLIKEKILKEEKINLEQISLELKISKSRLLHLIKQETGITYRKIILHYRLVFAMKYSSSMNLSRAALKAGFVDISHFSNYYKSTFGIKPILTIK